MVAVVAAAVVVVLLVLVLVVVVVVVMVVVLLLGVAGTPAPAGSRRHTWVRRALPTQMARMRQIVTRVSPVRKTG
jgi:hypothetical protein